MLIHLVKAGNSKQSWLGSVTLCPCCHSQQPKELFKVINGEAVCEQCQTELTEELLTA